MFEYGAILKGSQTLSSSPAIDSLFEYGAILKGSQTGAKIMKIFNYVWVWCNFKG